MANSKSNIYPVQLQNLFDKRKLKDLYCFREIGLNKSNFKLGIAVLQQKSGVAK